MALNGLMRTHHCGELRKSHVGEKVTLCGWVNQSRDLGNLHFIVIRDKYGITQLGFEKYSGPDSIFKEIGHETVIKAMGEVCERPAGASNKGMPTGEIEIQVTDLEILSHADKDNLPFLPTGKIEATDDLRLKYRYLDLRNQKLQNTLRIRSEATQNARNILFAEDFIEVETPILYKSTPEGARDYIVPSRVSPYKVYALPQSPQTLKQLLMIGGTDKYFQIARCFRDEDLRHDRQPEFSQIDIEVSFATQDYIKNLAEKIVAAMFKIDGNFKLEALKYQDVMRDYGSDKPDLRFGLKHRICTEVFKGTEFKVFADVMSTKGMIKAIFVPASLKSFARKEIDALTDIVKPYGGKGVAWFKTNADGRSGGISKFVTDEIQSQLEKLGDEKGEGTWFFFADASEDVVHNCADAVRRHFGKACNLIGDDYAFAFIEDFPLLEYDDKDQRFYAKHHPFTSPHPEDLDLFMKGDTEGLKNCRAAAYDVVCNGYELGGGSIRIHQNEVQKQMFKVLGMREEEVKEQFGFFIEALRYGVPPHGGIAFGLDRIIMLLIKTDYIKDAIAFPKTNSAADLMSGCPSTPNKDQLKELHFDWTKK